MSAFHVAIPLDQYYICGQCGQWAYGGMFSATRCHVPAGQTTQATGLVSHSRSRRTFGGSRPPPPLPIPTPPIPSLPTTPLPLPFTIQKPTARHRLALANCSWLSQRRLAVSHCHYPVLYPQGTIWISHQCRLPSSGTVRLMTKTRT